MGRANSRYLRLLLYTLENESDGRTAIGLAWVYNQVMLSRCFIYSGVCLLLCLSGCKSSPDASERSWWRPWPEPEFESLFEYDASGQPILPKVNYNPEAEAATDRQHLIRLLEKNNRLLERIADE